MTATGASSEANARIDGLFELAFRRHQAGELPEAEQLYRSILETDPRQLDALYFLGMIALQRGDAQDAVARIGEAIAGNDRIANYHAGIGEAYGALDRRDDALTHYRKAVKIEPGHWAALHQLASLLLERGEANEALEYAKRALTWKDSDAGRALFTDCVRSATSFPGDPVFRALLIRAISEPWARPVELAPAAVAVIKSQPVVASAVTLAAASWPRRLAPAQCGHAIAALAADDLARVLLDATPVPDAGLERLLTSVRTVLLDAAVNAQSDVSAEMISFAASLARQCFLNDYVFDVAPVERQALAMLRGKTEAALTGRAPVFGIHIIAIATFMPLHMLDREHGLLARKWQDAVTALIAEQVSEPRQEARLRNAMPHLTGISNDVSLKVREQYEENPYPRWTKIAAIQAEKGLVAALCAEFPAAPLDGVAEPTTPGILIAGCGSGQQPVTEAKRFPQAHILAIDLSLASLAYAQRKSAGLSIEYAQADIVELGSLNRRFDAIEASGVLHHLADPMQGWRTLLGLLKPGGFMRLGFYSARARADITAARKTIAERGEPATGEVIRRTRQEMMSSSDPADRSILLSPDFYSISTCRDLLFHVQEHVFTLPQIEAFLTEQNLTLLGFELGAPLRARYRAQFPDDPAMTNLANWDRFEAENPDTFGSMYNFWIRKAL
jgi:SAM-dependent methyltransferase